MYRKSRTLRKKRKSRKIRKQQHRRQTLRKQRGGLSEGFDDRVPDKALVVVRDAEDDSSPFVIVTKEEAMKNFSDRY